MKKNDIKKIALFLSGTMIGGLCTAVFWSSVGIDAQSELIAANSILTNVVSELEIEKKINTQLTNDLTAKSLIAENSNLLFEEKEARIKLQIDVLESNMLKRIQEWRKVKGSYDINLAELTGEVKQLKQRLRDADVFYAERYRLSKVISDLNERILKTSHKAELSQKACKEFKNGNSWNWVSEDDCKSYKTLKQKNRVMINEFDGASSKLDKVNRQLFAFGDLDSVKTP